MPLVNLTFLDGKTRPWETMVKLAENIRKTISETIGLDIKPTDVSCVETPTIPLVTEELVIVIISCLLNKPGRNDSVIESMTKKVGAVVKQVFANLRVEVIVEPLVNPRYAQTL